MQKIVNETGKPVITTDYLGGYQYENSTLKLFPTAEGYVEKEGGLFKYIYQYKDHLGNIRLSYEKSLAIKEESNFYPFGLKHQGYNNIKTGVENKYKYLGQERQDELGLNWDTFRYRNYDYAISRFMGVDPVSEDYTSISTYQFAHNNPIWKIEIEGLEGAVTSGGDIVNQEPNVFDKGMRWVSDYLWQTAETITGGPSYSTIVDPGQAKNVGDHVTAEVDNAVNTARAFITDPVGTVAAIGEDFVQSVRDLGSGDAKKTANAVIAIAPFFIAPETRVEGPLTKAEASATESSVSRTMSGHTKHGLNQSISRNGGKGVSASAKLDAVKNPKSITTQSSGNVSYKGRNATVVTNSEGKVVTTFGKSRSSNSSPQGRATGGGKAQKRTQNVTGSSYNPNSIR